MEPFRDNLDELVSRADALERENDAWRAEIARLRGALGLDPPKEPPPTRTPFLVLAFALALQAALLAYVLTRPLKAPPRLGPHVGPSNVSATDQL